MTSQSINLRAKFTVAFIAMALLTAVTGATGLFFTSNVGDKGVQIGAELAPLVNAVLTVRQRATDAHLKFEQLRTLRLGEELRRRDSEGNFVAKERRGASDREVDLIEIWAFLDETLFYANLVLDGGETEDGYLKAS